MKYFSLAKKTITGLLIFALVVPFLILPQRAQAQLLVSDPPLTAAVVAGNTAITTNLVTANVKTHVLDGIAWMVAKVAIQSITRSIVNWINSGFNGSPAFVGDLKNHLLSVGDGVTQQFVLQLTANAKINSPFLSSVIKGVATAYYLSTNKDAIINRLKYNLAERVQNDRAFLSGQFSEGGFNGWFAATQQPQNNPYGASLIAENELNNRIDSEVEKRLTELGWGKGFLSWRKCDSYASGGTTALSDADTCTNESIQTPGSVIENQLENSLGTGIRQLELADSFNEIVSALMGQLVSQVLSGGGGLLGTSQSSTRDTTPFLTQATSDTSGSASLQQSFVDTLDTFAKQVTTFQQNWTTIKNAAQGAKDALTTCNTSNATTVLTTKVEPVIAEANAHLADASTALASTTDLRTRATATVSLSTDAASLFLQLSKEYDVLISSISSEDFTNAVAESVDSTNPLSLYTQMNTIQSDVRGRLGCATVD